MFLADKCAEEIFEWDRDGVFIDATGIGWGIEEGGGLPDDRELEADLVPARTTY